VSSVVFAAAAASDALDGIFARRSGAADGHGTILDPLADKALVTLTLVAVVLVGRAPVLIAAIIVAREILTAAVRLVTYGTGVTTHAGAIAKAKTACEMTALSLLIAAPTIRAADIGALLLTAAAIMGVLTLPTYLPHLRRRFT